MHLNARSLSSLNPVILSIGLAVFSILTIVAGDLTNHAQTQDNSLSNAMLGVNPGRTRAYDIPLGIHPNSVHWKTSKLFVVDRSYPLTLTFEGIPGMSSTTIWTPSGHSFTEPVMAGDTIYFSIYINDGYVFAQRSETGGDKWRIKLPGVRVSTLAVTNDAVFGGSSDGTLFALNAATGQTVWNKVQKGSEFHTAAPLLVNGIVYFCSTEYAAVDNIRPKGRIFALDARTGNQLWLYETRSALGTASYAHETLFVGDAAGHLHALDAVTGQQRWTSKDFGDGIGASTTKNALVYFSTSDGGLHAVDARTGEERWKTKEPRVATALALDDSHVYFGGEKSNLYAIDAITGQLSWSYKTKNECHSPVLGGGVVCFKSGDILQALDAANGTEKWQVIGIPKLVSAPILNRSSIYFLDGDGHMYALK